MYRIKEYTNLIKARVFYDGKGAYTFNLDKGIKAPNPYVFRGDHNQFVRFLMAIKAKDNKTWPRSVRGERYADIASEIESGEDQTIYVWEHDFMRYINRTRESRRINEAILQGPNVSKDFYDFITSSDLFERTGNLHYSEVYQYKNSSIFITINPKDYSFSITQGRGAERCIFNVSSKRQAKIKLIIIGGPSDDEGITISVDGVETIFTA